SRTRTKETPAALLDPVASVIQQVVELRSDDERPVRPGGEVAKDTFLVGRGRAAAGERQRGLVGGEYRLDRHAVQGGKVTQDGGEHRSALSPQRVRRPFREGLTAGVLVDEDLHRPEPISSPGSPHAP